MGLGYVQIERDRTWGLAIGRMGMGRNGREIVREKRSGIGEIRESWRDKMVFNKSIIITSIKRWIRMGILT